MNTEDHIKPIVRQEHDWKRHEEEFITRAILEIVQKEAVRLNEDFSFAQMSVRFSLESEIMSISIQVETEKQRVYTGRIRAFTPDEVKLLHREGLNIITARQTATYYKPTKRYFELIRETA